ncbi:MAG TPA: cytochrome c3 family protein [candidate division Zixibacteria bacterium]|nr:hypothetical protein [candidate division Zixibacteria bacterium]MDD4918641.1 cytochrome c3 family protein [candidate division Zixibacteria bacterium]MDM7971745.1 cytochrome c3 family protein [candidate division Zixibacteria bacterium]HOD67261.1 cytochrome c3 family protein [candidate division Zixibacteria bacterium]HPM38465.1 cytochrome c3 family protein [candidate division Zixibacteria bacterium]
MKHTTLLLLALAALALCVAGCDREITGDVEMVNQPAAGCFDCHSDQDFDLAQVAAQYDLSAHAHSATVNENRLNGSQGCERCHTNEGFVAFVTGVPADGDYFTNFACFTCHAPHSTGKFGVRVETAVTLENGAEYDEGASNLCATCHHSRRSVNVYITDPETFGSTHWGPHGSPQADMYIGTNGYEYDDWDYSPSRHPSVIEDGCVACHMADPALWAPVGGHTFNIAGEVEVEDEPGMFEEVTNFANSCGGCHESFATINPVFPADIDYDYDGTSEGVQDEIHGLLDSLGVLLLNAGLVIEEDGLLEPDPEVTTSADSAGAVWNYLFVESEGSHGIHNTNYAVALLQSAIAYLAGDTGPALAGRPSLFSAH